MHNDPKNKCEVKRGTCKTSEKNGVHRRGWPCLPQNKNRRDDAIAPAVLQIYYVCLGPKSCIESPHCMTEKIRKPTKNITNKMIASWLLHPSSLIFPLVSFSLSQLFKIIRSPKPQAATINANISISYFLSLLNPQYYYKLNFLST